MHAADLNSSLIAEASLKLSAGMAVLTHAREDLEISEDGSYHRLLMQRLGNFGSYVRRRPSRLVDKHGVSSETRDMLSKKEGQSTFLLLLIIRES
jgi:hypothetical protein